MKNLKQKYQKPVVIDMGSVVNKTRATKCGQCWDGSPTTNDDTRSCSSDLSPVISC